MHSESALRQAVEEQLDLILKIEEERKLLKKENKVLKEEHQKMLNTLKKYNVQTAEQATSTELAQQQSPILLHQSTQADLDAHQPHNTSKLSSAHQLLNQLSASSHNLCSRCEDQLINTTSGPTDARRNSQNNQQVSNEIVKLAKEIAALKREAKDSETRGKQKDKELKELRRCLQVKSEALEKSRKEFNQLSQLFNADKFKSLRALEAENRELKARNAVLEEQGIQNTHLKQTLFQLTAQYEEYREDREDRLARVVAELKEKDSRCEQLTRQLQKSYSLS